MANQTANPFLSLMEIPPGYLNIMGYVDESEVNGPGCRAVVWVQGCHRQCPQAINEFMCSIQFFRTKLAGQVTR